MSLRTAPIDKILQLDGFHNRISYFNVLFTDCVTFFRASIPVPHEGRYIQKSLIELVKEYLNVVGQMAHRLSIIIFTATAPHEQALVISFKNMTALVIDNIAIVRNKLMQLVQAEKYWPRVHFWARRHSRETNKPVPAENEIYWTNVLKKALDTLQHQVRNLAESALGLGNMMKVQIEVQKDAARRASYSPQLTFKEAKDERKEQIQKATGESII